jgi:tetratricopeptide (TPR) repeat protein
MLRLTNEESVQRPAMKLILTTAILLSVPAAVEATQGGVLNHYKSDPRCGQTQVVAPPLSEEARRGLESKLAEARAAYEKRPDDADAIIWLGRRVAYLGRFDEAIRIFTEGARKHPRDARMYRHRGHRLLTLRCFKDAADDLERAARLVRDRADEVEPDGLPNARNIPTSTLKTNVFYHLGLAYYFQGDFARARGAFRECLRFSKNPDMLAATSHWLYLTLRRLGRGEEARRVLEGVDDSAEVIENHDYRRLLLMYKGKATPESLLEEASKEGGSLSFASTAYGVGAWHAASGQPAKALKVFLDITRTPQRTSFGYIAAEADLKRMGVSAPAGLPERKLYE